MMVTNRINGKSALITGGTRGIGFAIAEALLKRGARIFICGTSQAGVDNAVDLLQASYSNVITGIACNVRNYDQVRTMMRATEEKFGGLDILINNAGIGLFNNVEKMSPAEWRATIETNLSGVFYCCREAIPLMKKRGAGYIINIGSLAGKNVFPGSAAYSATKFGLIGFSEALMQEVRYSHIRVSYIMPGSVNTEFGDSSPQDPSKAWKLMPKDVAATVVSLLEMDPRALSSRVEIRPSEPQK